VEVRDPQVQQPVPEPERGIHQRGPRLFSDGTVLCELVLSLELPHSRQGGAQEDAVDTGGAEVEAEHRQPLLHILDRSAAVTL